jgi:hypothetical protein
MSKKNKKKKKKKVKKYLEGDSQSGDYGVSTPFLLFMMGRLRISFSTLLSSFSPFSWRAIKVHINVNFCVHHVTY